MVQEEEGRSGSYGLRPKRRRAQLSADEAASDNLERLLALADSSTKIVVFSGSGLSTTSGMSTFSTKGGLYERAQKKFKLSDGKMLFTYQFFDRQRPEAQAFFADIYLEAESAEPAAGHHALAQLLRCGRLRRHYTLNIDGLAQQAGVGSWHMDAAPDGLTVEMHGNVRSLVCARCNGAQPLTPALARRLKAREQLACGAPGCDNPALRFKVLMYEDGEGESITPNEVLDLMEADVKAADLVLWVGISFQQSASTAYFKNVRHWLQEVGRSEEVVQALVNPSDEALWNLLTACSNLTGMNVLGVLGAADDVLPALAERLQGLPHIEREPAPLVLESDSEGGEAGAAAEGGQRSQSDRPQPPQQQQQQQGTSQQQQRQPGGGGGGAAAVGGQQAPKEEAQQREQCAGPPQQQPPLQQQQQQQQQPALQQQQQLPLQQQQRFEQQPPDPFTLAAAAQLQQAAAALLARAAASGKLLAPRAATLPVAYALAAAPREVLQTQGSSPLLSSSPDTVPQLLGQGPRLTSTNSLGLIVPQQQPPLP